VSVLSPVLPRGTPTGAAPLRAPGGLLPAVATQLEVTAQGLARVGDEAVGVAAELIAVQRGGGATHASAAERDAAAQAQAALQEAHLAVTSAVAALREAGVDTAAADRLLERTERALVAASLHVGRASRGGGWSFGLSHLGSLARHLLRDVGSGGEALADGALVGMRLGGGAAEHLAAEAAHEAAALAERGLLAVVPSLGDAAAVVHAIAERVAVARGLSPAVGDAVVHVGRVAAGWVAGRLLADGPGSARPVPGAGRLAPAPGSLAGWLDGACRLEAPGQEGRVAITDAAGTWVVQLPGIHTLGSAADPQDLRGAVLGVLTGRSSYVGAVRDALRQAGVPGGARVVLVGHSQGGIAAMDLARSPVAPGGWQVTAVVAAGSPVTSLPPRTGSGVRELEVDDRHDLVPALDLHDSAREPAAGRTVLVFDHDTGTVSGNHDCQRSYATWLASPAGRDATAAWSRDASWVSTRATVRTQVFALTDAGG